MHRFALPLVLLLSSITAAQNSSALMNEALDKIYPLDFPNTTLLIAMKAIGEQTGVRIEAAPGVWELLPWGDQTTISAQIKGTTLRDSLEVIARKLGLQVVLKDEAVQLQPMPALARLGRRSSVQELQALDVLASNKLGLNTDRPTVRQVVDAVDAKLQAFDADLTKAGKKALGFAVEFRAADAARPDQQITVPRNATILDALESISKETRATWSPWGTSIVVLPKEDQIRNQLGKTVTIRYSGVEVSQVLAELSQRSGVEFTIEPGAIQRIPPEFRTIRGVLDNATIKQALEYLAGLTGLGYVVNESGVYIWNQMLSAAGTARDPVVGQIPLDNGLQMFVRQSELPPEVVEYLRVRRTKEVDKIRQMMREEGFKPTTRPATSPSGEPL